jgi:hypothetical protein
LSASRYYALPQTRAFSLGTSRAPGSWQFRSVICSLLVPSVTGVAPLSREVRGRLIATKRAGASSSSPAARVGGGNPDHQRARALIADESRWCRGELARDVKGRGVCPMSDSAMKRCGLGALLMAAYEITSGSGGARRAMTIRIDMPPPVATPYLLNHTGVCFTVVDGMCRGCS